MEALATVNETKSSPEDTCEIHKEGFNFFSTEDQIPLCSVGREPGDHAVMPGDQPGKQGTGRPVNRWEDGFPESEPTCPSIRGFSNANTLEKGESIGGNGDNNREKLLLEQQWMDFSLENRKEAGTQPSSRVKNSVTWIVLILFIIQIVGLVTTIFVFTKAKPHLPTEVDTNSCCPPGWIASQGNCYHVLELEGTWKAGQNHCYSLGGSLAVFEDLAKLIGAVKVKKPFNHWIGLARTTEEKWKWPDGTLFSNHSEVEGDGQCAYLRNRALSSGDCGLQKKGLCSHGRSDHRHCRGM